MKNIKDGLTKKIDQIFNTEYGSGWLGKIMSILGLVFIVGFVIVGIILFPEVIDSIKRLQEGDPVYIEFFIMMLGTALSWLTGLVYGIRFIKDKTSDLVETILMRMGIGSYVFINVTLIVVDLFIIGSVTGFFTAIFFAFCVLINAFLMFLWCSFFTFIGTIIVGIILFSFKALLHNKVVRDRKKKIENSSLYQKIISSIKNDLHVVKSVVVTESEVKIIFDGKDTDTFVFREYGFSNLDKMGFSIIMELLQSICKGFKVERLKESTVLGNPKFIKKPEVKKVEPMKKEKEVKEEKEDW